MDDSERLARRVLEITRFARLHQVLLDSTASNYPKPELDWTRALCFFLSGYAFERSGRSPSYSTAAVDAVGNVGPEQADKPGGEYPAKVWCAFLRILNLPKSGDGANRNNNPLYPKERPGKVPITSFLTEISDHQHNIVQFTLSKLREGQVDLLYGYLGRVRGVGNKIIGLFLRDIAIMYDIAAVHANPGLQPVDTWVRRTVRLLMGRPADPPNGKQDVQDSDIARRAIEYSCRAGVSPLDFNRASWHFGSQIAKSSYNLTKYFREDFDVQKAVESRIRQSEAEVVALRAILQSWH